MNGFGDSFRDAFEHMVKEMGDTILIYKDWGQPSQTIVEVRGLKNNEKGRPKDVMFQFLEDPGITVGDVLQQKNSRDLWRVTEIHDDVIGDVYQHFEARVENMGGATRTAAKPGHKIVIRGDVHGGIQVESPGAVQHNNVSITNIENDLRQLRDLFARSALSPLDKEEAAHALIRVAELVNKPKSPDVLAKIGGKINELKQLTASVAVLTTTASPMLSGLWDKIEAAFR